MGSQALRPSVAEGEPILRAMDAIRRLVRTLRVTARTAEARGVSAAQLFVLQALAASPAPSMNALAGRTHTDPSSVSVVVAKLATAGLVSRTRDDEDARRFGIALTTRGRRLVTRSPVAVQGKLADAIAALDPKLRRAMTEALEKVIDDLGGTALAPTMFFEETASTTPRRKR